MQGRQRLEEAWWTGPLLAPSAATLPRGHFLIEPYLYDVTTQGRYDSAGARRSATHSNGFGSLTYLNYGLLDRVTVGAIPTLGFTTVSGSPSSSGVELGDLTLQGQVGITRFRPCHRAPAIAVAIQETFPTGKYDRLGNRPADGLGGGAYSTTVALFSQKYFWLPNGRILRTRLNVLQTFSNVVSVRDVSVYGTGTGFRGHAYPGSSLFLDLAGEYSLTRSWVLALDIAYRQTGNTHVAGRNLLDPAGGNVNSDLGSSRIFFLAPAVEYNWKPNLGAIVGVRLVPAGRNATSTLTPVMAINFVH